jgi:pimeloyl-ACP methyl ester carboxylesterase
MTARERAKGGSSKGAGAKRRTVSTPPDEDGPRARPGFLNCPECDKEVKEKNLEVHLRRVHGMTVPEAKAVVDKMFEVTEKDTRSTAFFISVAALVLVIALIAAGAYLLLTKNQGEQGPTAPKDYMPITFQTSDGWELHGDLYTTTGNKPYLLLVHGLNEDRSAYKTFAKDMHVRGYGVLAYDSRGFGESKVRNGAYQDKLTGHDVQNSTRDIVAALDSLEVRNMTGNGIVLVGASVGANTAAIVAVNYTEVKELVLLSPSVDYQAVRPFQSLKKFTGGLLLVAYTGDSLAYLSCQEFETNATLAKSVNFFYKDGNLHGTSALAQSDMRSKIEGWIMDNI